MTTIKKKFGAVLAVSLLFILLLSIHASAASGSVNGLSIATKGSKGRIKTGTNSATLTVKQSWSLSGGTTEDTFVFTYPSSNTKDVQVTFDYTFSGTAKSITGVTDDTGAKCSVKLSPGGSFSIYLKATAGYVSSSESKFTITNLSVNEVADSSQVTINYDSKIGTVTANGLEVKAYSTIEVSGAGTKLAATPSSNAVFVAWIDDNGNIISDKSEFDYSPIDAAQTLTALFTTSTTPWFYVDNGSRLVEGWEEAMKHSGVVALANNATLPAGNYTVPSGVTLLIPYDSALTCRVETPDVATPAKHSEPTAYRTLTLASGAHITVNGIMTVPSKVFAGDTKHAPCATMVSGQYGHVYMNSSSSITIKSGAELSAFGYITGSGNVVAESGAKVYEAFQILGFRGGTVTSSMATAKKVFPLSQYYVQNIEVPLYLYSGAQEIAYVALYMSDTIIESSVTYIGRSGCLFNLTSGYLVKQYDRINDRQQIDIYGKIDVSGFSLNINFVITYPINSSDFVVPITNNMTVNIHDGSTVNIGANMSMLPGAEINIYKGGTLKLTSGKSLYLYDLDEWKGKGYVFSGIDFAPVEFVPNRVKTRTAADLKDAQIVVEGTLDASNGKLYTSNGGAAIMGVEGGRILMSTVSQTTDQQATQPDDAVYHDITMNSAKLKNADGTYTQSTEGTFTYVNGVWQNNPCAAGHTPGETKEENRVEATCTEAGSYDQVVYCSVDGCNAEISREKKTIKENGHTPAAAVIEKEVAATCGENGSHDSVIYCSVQECKAEISRETVTVNATGKHTYDNDCDTECNTCKATRETTHKYDAAVTAPTCTAGGYTTYTCSVCGDTYKGDETAKIDHTAGDPVVENDTDATCGAAGSYEEVVYCSICKTYEISRVNKTVDALPHSPAAVVEENKVESTCIVAGSYDAVVYCSVCNGELSRETKALALAEHTSGQAVRENENDSTCYAEGSYDEVVYCSVQGCGEKMSSTPKTIAKKDHTPAQAVRENEVAATCYRAGSYDEVVYCSVSECKYEISREEKTIEKLAHTPGEAVFENVVAATCYSEGSCDEVVYCTVEACKAQISRTPKVIEKTKHPSTKVVREITTEPTCYAKGSAVDITYCAVEKCNAEISRTSVTLEEIAHTPGEPVEVEGSRVDATCGADGSYVQVTYCTVAECGTEISRTTVVLPATGAHVYETETERVEVTCTVDGYVIMACVCGATQTTVFAAPGHNYENSVVVTPPTCEDDGYTTHTCSCGDSKKDTPVAATGHTDSNDDNICDVATCGKTICVHVWDIAYSWEIKLSDLTNPVVKCTAYGTCITENGCGRQQTATADIWEETILIDDNAKAPDCDEDGFATFYAVFADSWLKPEEGKWNASKYVPILATGHSMAQITRVEPTCTVPGNVAYWHCSVCKMNFEDEKGKTPISSVVIPETGHNHTPVVTAPTCADDGYTTYTCACGDSYTSDVVPATGKHNYVTGWCDEKEKWSECSVCHSKTDVELRTYDVTVVDYWGNTTVRKGYTYGQYLWLNYSTSNVLDLEYLGWSFEKDGQAIPAYEVWTQAPIGADTTAFTVYEVSQVKGVKYGAIMMSVNYDKANSEQTMTVDLFLYVDSLNDADKPSVKLGDVDYTDKMTIIHESIMMWFVSIPLSAEQITQGGTNVQITVSYKGVPVKTIDSVLIAYEKALEKYLEENVGDYAGNVQDEAINAMLNYGKTVQVYFENQNPNDWNFKGYDDIANYTSSLAPTQKSNDDETFTWMGANVKFDEEYSMRYEIELILPNGATATDATATLTVRDKYGEIVGKPYTDLDLIPKEITLDNGSKQVEPNRYYVIYPVPASDLALADTTVHMTVTLADGTSIESPKYDYGIHAHLTYSIYLYMEYTNEDGTTYHKNYVKGDKTGEKTNQYVDMLVSLLKLGEAVNKVEAMTPNQ